MLKDEIAVIVDEEQEGSTVAGLLAMVQVPGEYLRCVVTVDGKMVSPRRKVKVGETVIFWPVDLDSITVDYVEASPCAPDWEYTECLQCFKMVLLLLLGICLAAFLACLVMDPS